MSKHITPNHREVIYAVDQVSLTPFPLEGDSNSGSLNVNVLAGLDIPTHDYIAVTYPTTTQEVYTYKAGGSGGSTVATVTVNYTDSSKEFISNVART